MTKPLLPILFIAVSLSQGSRRLAHSLLFAMFTVTAIPAFAEVTSASELARKNLCFPVLGTPCVEPIFSRQSGTRTHIVLGGSNRSSDYTEDVWSQVEFQLVASLAVVQCAGFSDNHWGSDLADKAERVCKSTPNVPGLVFYSEPQAGTRCRPNQAERAAYANIERALTSGEWEYIDEAFFGDEPTGASPGRRGWATLKDLRRIGNLAPEYVSWEPALSEWTFAGWHSAGLVSFGFKFENDHGTTLNDSTGEMLGTSRWSATKIVEHGLKQLAYWDKVFSEYSSILADYHFVNVTEDTESCSRDYLQR